MLEKIVRTIKNNHLLRCRDRLVP